MIGFSGLPSANLLEKHSRKEPARIKDAERKRREGGIWDVRIFSLPSFDWDSAAARNKIAGVFLMEEQSNDVI